MGSQVKTVEQQLADAKDLLKSAESAKTLEEIKTLVVKLAQRNVETLEEDLSLDATL